MLHIYDIYNTSEQSVQLVHNSSNLANISTSTWGNFLLLLICTSIFICAGRVYILDIYEEQKTLMEKKNIYWFDMHLNI